MYRCTSQYLSCNDHELTSHHECRIHSHSGCEVCTHLSMHKTKLTLTQNSLQGGTNTSALLIGLKDISLIGTVMRHFNLMYVCHQLNTNPTTLYWLVCPSGTLGRQISTIWGGDAMASRNKHWWACLLLLDKCALDVDDKAVPHITLENPVQSTKWGSFMNTHVCARCMQVGDRPEWPKAATHSGRKEKEREIIMHTPVHHWWIPWCYHDVKLWI